MIKIAKKPFALVLSLMMVSSAFIPVFGSAKMSDYDSHWAKTTIQSSIALGIIHGYPDGSIKPDNTITRVEFFEMVNNAFKFTKSSNVIYTDVAKTGWYYDTVAKTNAAGYISGYMDGSIHPEDRITRQEVAVIVNRLKDLTATSNLLSFSDSQAIPDWGKQAIIAAFEAKIMSGYPDGSFKPDAPITRSEALVAVNKCMNYQAAAITPDLVYNEAGSYGPSEGTVTIQGNVVINVPGVTLKNALVKGNVTIAKSVGDGNVPLENVTVRGITYINGGGVDKIQFKNFVSPNMVILKDAGSVGVVISGTSVINEVKAVSDVTLEETNLTGTGFEGITVEDTAANGMSIKLVNVKCDRVDLKADGTAFSSDTKSIVTLMTVSGADAKITGLGTITSAVVTGTGVTFETPALAIK